MTTIKYDLNNLPELTGEDIKRIAAISDEAIDYSDIAPLDDEFFTQAIRGGLYKLKPQKEKISVNIDKDVLLWLKQSGKGYQTRINAILRKAMLDTMK